MPHTETQLESKEIFNGHVIHVTLDTVRLEDGRTSLREIVHHHGGACVLPIDDEGCIYLVRQFRYAFGEEIWELPAGKLEPGEDPFESAKSAACLLTITSTLVSSTPQSATTARRSTSGPPRACTKAASIWTPESSWMSCGCPLTKPCKKC